MGLSAAATAISCQKADELFVPATVDRSDVERGLESDRAVVVDARPAGQYLFGHIEGAVNVPFDSSDLEKQVRALRLREKEVIVYCSSASCSAAEVLAAKLVDDWACPEVRIYPGGWAEWSAATR